MAGITHDKVLTGSDGTNPNRAQPSDWNADHVLPDPLDLTGDLNVDTIDESTTDAGVTIEGVLLKDSGIEFSDPLSEYDEGEWTPELGFLNAGDESWSYITQVGRYTRIGNVVFCRVFLSASSVTHSTASGSLQLKGLPFAVAGSGVYGYGSGAVTLTDVVNYMGATLTPYTGQTYCLFSVATTTAPYSLSTSEITTGESPWLSGSFIYEV
jgi:hypothetical protein